MSPSRLTERFWAKGLGASRVARQHFWPDGLNTQCGARGVLAPGPMRFSELRPPKRACRLCEPSQV